jgi:RNA polymerase sigma factor (sigma-70 family)
MREPDIGMGGRAAADADDADRSRLARFVAAGEGRALAELVSAHAGAVHAAALRQTRSPELAEEVTQIVFILLARKAASLGPTVMLGAWLHRTAFYTARNVVRQQARRRRHERLAAVGEAGRDPWAEPPTWQRLAPALDAGVAGLREADRQAIVLRFFHRQSLAEVGRALGVSEDAAQMRVSRAVDRLRAFFARTGVTRLDACALANVLWANGAARAVPRAVLVGAFRAARAVPPAGGAAAALARAVAWGRARAVAVAAVAATVVGTAGTIYLLERAVLHGPATPIAVVERHD